MASRNHQQRNNNGYLTLNLQNMSELADPSTKNIHKNLHELELHEQERLLGHKSHQKV